jgi:hypothetical protein
MASSCEAKILGFHLVMPANQLAQSEGANRGDGGKIQDNMMAPQVLGSLDKGFKAKGCLLIKRTGKREDGVVGVNLFVDCKH